MTEIKPVHRRTTNFCITHEQHGEKPSQFLANYARLCSVDEQVYERNFVATEEWKYLDLGWFSDRSTDVGLIVVENREGQGQLTVPTKDEARRLKNASLCLAYNDGADKDLTLQYIETLLEIPHGESQPLLVVPERVSLWMVRCHAEMLVRGRIYVYPR